MNNHTLHEKVPLLTHGLIENRLIHNFGELALAHFW